MKNLMPETKSSETVEKMARLLAQRGELLCQLIYNDSMSMARRWQIDNELGVLHREIVKLEKEGK